MGKRFFIFYYIVISLYFIFNFISTWCFAPISIDFVSHFKNLEPWKIKMFLWLWSGVLAHLLITTVSFWLLISKRPLGFLILLAYTLYGLYGSVSVSLSIFYEEMSWFYFPNKMYALFNMIVFVMSSIAVVTILKKNYLARKNSSTY